MLSAVTGRPLPLLGGALCLDFVNTIDPRLKPPQEDFVATLEQLIEWSRYVGLLTRREERTLLAQGKRDSSLAADVHARALELREALYQLLRPGKHGRSEALETLNQEIVRTAAHRTLVAGDGGYRLGWKSATTHERLLGTIAQSGADLLTSPDLGLVGECVGEGCGWLFLDTSKAHRRRWCSMDVCGNRAKAQRHRQRSRGQIAARAPGAIVTRSSPRHA